MFLPFFFIFVPTIAKMLVFHLSSSGLSTASERPACSSWCRTLCTAPSPTSANTASCPTASSAYLALLAVSNWYSSGTETNASFFFFFPTSTFLSLSHSTQLKEAFDRGDEPDYSEVAPSDVATVLKYFFRAMPEPLLTMQLYTSWVEVPALPTDEDKLEALRLLCALLSDEHRFVLQDLLGLLHEIAVHANEVGVGESGATAEDINITNCCPSPLPSRRKAAR